MCMLPVLGPRYLRGRRLTTDHVHCWTLEQLVFKAQTPLLIMRAHLPLLVFEMLKRQVYDFLYEAIQKRMQWDLGRRTELIFSSGISLCCVRIT